MGDFKRRFAEYNAATGEYAFSNVRNGLIVGLVCILCLADGTSR
jgi:SP family sugar:H+ symporter-like MFS transporter